MKNSNPHEGQDYYIAHQFCTLNRKQIEKSKICGCFWCLAKFAPAEINEWTDFDDNDVGQTALCPKCDIDTVIGSESGFEITDELLKKMKDYWMR